MEKGGQTVDLVLDFTEVFGIALFQNINKI